LNYSNTSVSMRYVNGGKSLIVGCCLSSCPIVSVLLADGRDW
jgi:hypothetical protein